MQDVDVHLERNRRLFLSLWITATVIKVVIAARLPLFVDEAFYWQEGQRLAAAYSDLPGLTAWLARVGVELGGPHLLALRMPFLLIGALLPWVLIAAARRLGAAGAAWQTGMLAVLMPLSGTLGLLALPDVPMALASALCLAAGARLLVRVDWAGVCWLAAGLVIGALSHYRFVGVIGVGLLALLCLPEGRRLLLNPRIWLALLVGALAWLPLLLWNLQHADAGLRFQLVDRHPWSFQWTGLNFVLVQAAFVTPVLFVALLLAARDGVRASAHSPAVRYLAWLGAISTLGFFVLGFFADVERVSFHWPLPGYLALLVIVPMYWQRWRPLWRRLAWALLGIGLAGMLLYYLVLSIPALRERTASSKYYPYNFAGWNEVAARVRERHARMPAGTLLLADNFKIGAELGFHLQRDDIRVLDHPLNHKHGRAPQLALWNLQTDSLPAQPSLLIVSSTDVKLKQLVAHYQSLCERLGPLPAPEVVNIDHGAQRFLLFALDGQRRTGPCVAPAIAYFNQPRPGASVGRVFDVQGWALKEGVGVAQVVITLDGQPVAQAEYGQPDSWLVNQFYAGRPRDPHGANIGFRAQVQVPATMTGTHWLGMDIIGTDGSRERWAEQRVTIR